MTNNNGCDIIKYKLNIKGVIGGNIMEMYLEVCDRINQYQQEKTRLEKEMSDIDLIIVDIEHLMEFSRVSASEGYNIYKEAGMMFTKRRNIKDDIQEVRETLCHLNTVKQGLDNLKNSENKKSSTYNVRSKYGEALFKKYSNKMKENTGKIKYLKK